MCALRYCGRLFPSFSLLVVFFFFKQAATLPFNCNYEWRDHFLSSLFRVKEKERMLILISQKLMGHDEIKIIAGNTKGMKNRKKKESDEIDLLPCRSLYIYIDIGFRVYLFQFSYICSFHCRKIYSRIHFKYKKNPFSLFMCASHVNISFCLFCLRLHAQSNIVFITLSAFSIPYMESVVSYQQLPHDCYIFRLLIRQSGYFTLN